MPETNELRGQKSVAPWKSGPSGPRYEGATMGFSPGGRLCSVTRAQPPPQGLKPHLKSPDAALKRRSSTVLLTFRILTCAFCLLPFLFFIRPWALNALQRWIPVELRDLDPYAGRGIVLQHPRGK